MPVHADRRLVAAITAAVAAYLGTPAEAVRVRRIEPVPGGMPAGPAPGWPGPWAMAGRLAQMAGRQLPARLRKEGRH